MSDTISKMKDIGAIRKYDGVLYVRNETDFAITLNTKEELFTLGPKGSDENVKVLPKGAMMLGGFHRLLMKDHISVSPEFEDFATEAMLSASSANDARLEAMHNTLEAPGSDVDMIERKCLISGERVFQTHKEIKDHVPPLAARYKGREHEFVPVEKADGSVGFARRTITKE